jgi:hypothetical protein
MALKDVYDSADDIPEEFRSLYEEKDSKHVFKTSLFEPDTIATKSVGIKKLKDEAGGYRVKLKEVSTLADKYKAFGAPEELQEKLDKIAELEALAAAGGSKSKEAAAELAKTMTAQEKVKWEREIAPKLAEADKSAKLVGHYEAQEQRRAVQDAALKAINTFKQGKLDPGAVEDALLYAERHLVAEVERDEETGLLVVKSVRTKDGVGVTPDVEADSWLSEMVGRKSHWLQGSEGSGANGSPRGKMDLSGNPWSRESWHTGKQGDIVRTKGAAIAEQMAKHAGTTLGGLPPKAKAKS